MFKQESPGHGNGAGLFGNISSTQSSIIIPVPGSTTRYYVFTTGTPNDYGLAYSVVDMTLANGLGAVTAIKNVYLNTTSAEKLAATQHCDGTSYWVLTAERANNVFRAYRVTANAIQPAVNSTAGNAVFFPPTEGGQLKICLMEKK